jgi:hypothetical protein
VTLVEPSWRRRRDLRRRRRGRFLWAALVLGAAAALFGIGVAVGEALHDNPKPGGTHTVTGTIVLTATDSVVSK